MVKFTKLFCVLVLCLFGMASANAKVEQVHATFENPSNTQTTWTPDGSGATLGTFTWSATYYNQLKNIGLPTGDITKYKKLVVDTEIKSGEQFRILIYKGGSNLTLYASNGVNEFILADTLKVLYPDTYNEFLLACDEICLSGNNNVAPGEAIIKDVYLETYDDEGEKVYATFENPSNTQTTWTPDGTGETLGTFTWSATYYNQLKNIGLPNGDITKYKKLVVDTEIKSGEQFRILIYKGGSSLVLYASNGVNEFILADTLKALYPDTYNEFLLACDEICLSGNNNVAPGEAVIKSVYLETYPENETVDIPDIVYEEDPGKPAGDFVDFTEAFPELQPRIGLGTDGHPIVLGNGEVIVGQRSQTVIADLSAYSKLTMITSPNLKLVLYMNHEVAAQQNAGDYNEDDAGKYVFMDVQADENGLIEVDLTQFDKQELNCICLPWDNNNKGTVWYILLTEKPHEYAIVGDFTGGWPSDENPRPDMLMTQSEEDSNVYTLVIEHFEAEAKTYEYKLRDHYSWDNTYQLPASGNNNYVFTKAGTYTLTFTANVAENVLTLNVEKEEITDIKTMAIAGDLTGGWPVKNEETGEWDWSMAMPMIQDSEDPNLWSVTIQGVKVEAKKYEYKAFANNSYFGYQLPAEGNAEFIFGTKNYPAGTYTLTFTANVGEHNHWLKLEAINENPEATDINFDVAGGDIAQALELAKTGVTKVGNITINLRKGVEYTIGSTLIVPNDLVFYGNDAIVTVADENTDPFITLDGTEAVAMKADGTESDHKLIKNIEIRGVTVKGLQNALVKDNQKTLVENIIVDFANIEMPASNKNVFDFNGKGYVGELEVNNSTIWAKDKNTGFFAQYGSRPKNVNEDWYQVFAVFQSTFVNIANGKNFCDMKQNGTDKNIYKLMNSIFVDCGKSGQTVVGFNKGQTSATPEWYVVGNYFEWGGECKNAAETEKAGQKDEKNIVQDCVEGKLTFTDAANGDFNGEFELAEGATAPQSLGAPIWTITFKSAPVAVPDYYLVGNLTGWEVNEDYKLVANEATEGEFMITLDVPANTEFKIVKGEKEVWYPGDGKGNCTINDAGNYTVYFRPDYSGGEGWFENCIYVAPTAPVYEPILADGTYYVMNAGFDEPNLYLTNGSKVAEDGYPLTFTFDSTNGKYTIAGNDFFAGAQWTLKTDDNYTITISKEENGVEKFVAVDDNYPGVRNLVLAETAQYWFPIAPAYYETVDFVTYDVRGTFNNWTPAVMAKNEETGLFEITIQAVDVTNDYMPAFKVVANEAVWYPAGGEETNWVITPTYLDGEGNYDITITFNAATKEIGVTGKYNGVPTGINAVAAEKANNVIFNLNGQRVMNAQKGMYIINGKKVVLK